MKDTSLFHKHFLQDLLLVCLIFCLVTIFSYIGMLDFFNWKIFDLVVTQKSSGLTGRKTPEHRHNVAIVCIDQKSIDFFAENKIGWPWPREFHGRLVAYLTECGAKAIVFDVIFSEQDIDRIGVVGADSDDAFAEAIEESGITYLAVAAQEGIPRFNRGTPESFFRSSPGLTGGLLYLENNEAFQKATRLQEYKSAVFPLQKFQKGVKGLGLVNMEPENDGIHRRYPLISKIGNHYVPSLGFAVVRDILGKEAVNTRLLDQIGKGRFVDRESKFFLNWYGKGGPEGVYDYYSYHAVIVSSVQIENGETPIIPRDAFKDKIVLIGSNAPGLFDLKSTPFTHITIYPGMEIHATAIENMLDEDFIYRIPSWLLILCMVVITIVVFGIDKFFKSLRVFIAVYVFLIVCELAVSYLFMIMRKQWISSAEILGATTFVFAGLVISGYFRETREKRVLRGHFGRYVNDSVLREILANPGSVDFKGRTINATIMATDIAGFTSISEALPPYEVVTRLNDYLSEVSETLIDNGAFINKYIGDAILALYGAFGEPDHEKKACHAALNANRIITRKIQEALTENKTPLVTRMGITTGEMTMGNIGSERKIEYTVIGDTVNTAFRLEGLNKFYKTTILVSEHTKNGIGDDFEFRLLDILQVKGKETPERVYELLGLKGEVDTKILRWRDEFEGALILYQNRKFLEANELFSQLGKEGDPPSGVFEKRCIGFIKDPPPPEWNGIWKMKRK